ncbi:hypothetical protein PVAP13_5NG381946 [Panicum virgatum]|uniref:Uncharacterized protein n=1 Tax=Panicum virgatum TaxID=38727 RepID=A0A8T0RY93_PANVG|nr:hypothetical protein PVAP13_5NG381946 [Panicum virgatum]
MVPVKLLLGSSRTTRDGMLPISYGMFPCNPLLSLMTMILRLVQRLMFLGITPAIMLYDRLRLLRRLREPMLGGISPCRPLSLRSSVRRKVRLPMAGEMVPVSDWELSCRATTRHHRCLLLQVTPSQVQ